MLATQVFVAPFINFVWLKKLGTTWDSGKMPPKPKTFEGYSLVIGRMGKNSYATLFLQTVDST